MEASHKTHRPHIKVGKDEEEEEEDVARVLVLSVRIALRVALRVSVPSETSPSSGMYFQL